MVKDEELEPYTTSDTPFAAFLHLNGMVVLTTRDDPNDYKRQIFIFIDIAERPDLEQAWQDNTGDFRSYYASLKTVQHKLRGRKNNKTK